MPRFSIFTPFGHWAFSSKPSLVEQFYRLLPQLWGSQLDFTVIPSYNEEKLYAVARMCAMMVAELQHAGNQANPLKAYDLLPLLELDYLVSPGPNDTVPTRQKAVAAAMRLARGAIASNVVATLKAIAGSAFLAYAPNPTSQPGLITNAQNNGSGLIRLTVPIHRYTTADRVLVANVGGTVEANGVWEVTVIDANTLDLVGSAFAHPYTSGGTIKRLPTIFPVSPASQPGLFADVRQPAKVLKLVDPAAVIGATVWCAYQALDTSSLPTISWAPASNFANLSLVLPTLANFSGFFYQCTTPGVSGATEPTWPTTPGATVVDGGVTWTCIDTIAPALFAGEPVVMDPGNTSQMERVTVAAFSTTPPPGSNTTPGYLYFQATFNKSHDVGSPMTTGHVPYWWSTQRLNYAVLTAAGATDAPTRAKVDAILAKILRGVSTWAIVQPSSTTLTGGTLGPLSAGLPMGTTPIGTLAFQNSN